MKIHMKLKSVAIFALTSAIVIVLAYSLIPLWLMHVKAYTTVASFFRWSPSAPQALLLTAQNTDTMDGPGFVYIFPGNELSSSGHAVPRAKVVQAKGFLNRLIHDFPRSTYAQTARLFRIQVDEQLRNWTQAIQELQQEVASPSNLAHSRAKVELHALLETTNARHPQLVGKVTRGGNPVSHAFVFLRPMVESNSFSTDVIDAYAGAFTTNTGIYKISGITPGRYQVCIGVTPKQAAGYFLPLPQNESIVISKNGVTTFNLPFVQRIVPMSPRSGETISGKSITFSWRPYPHAAYYDLGLTDYFNVSQGNFDSIEMQLKGDEKTNHATFSVKALRDILPGRAYSSAGKSSATTIAPASALGLIYPGGEFSWDVNAYDARGHLLSSSRSIYIGLPTNSVPIFHLSKKGELEGDSLLLQQKQAAAVLAYKKEIPNPYALRALAVLTMYGKHAEGGSEADAKQALAYLRQIPHPTPSTEQLMSSIRKRMSQIKAGG